MLLVDEDTGRKPVTQLAFAADLLEPVAARHQLLHDRPRKPILDLHSRAAAADVAGSRVTRKRGASIACCIDMPPSMTPVTIE